MLNIPTANIKTNMIHFFILPLHPFIILMSEPFLLPQFPNLPECRGILPCPNTPIYAFLSKDGFSSR